MASKPRSRSKAKTATAAEMPLGTPFVTEKHPATGSRGMVVTNHPLASAAGMEMLAAGGNAVDAGIAALFTLTVVEPMMVGLLGGGMAHLRLPDGQHLVVDNMATAPAAATPGMFTPLSQEWPAALEVEGKLNQVGASSVATPGNLAGWAGMLARFGTMRLFEVVQPAMRAALRGFSVTPYLAECVREAAPDMARDKTISAIFLPGGEPVKPGAKLVQSEYGETLREIGRHGAELLHGGALGRQVAAALQAQGGALALEDLRDFKVLDRQPVRGSFRDMEVVGPPPPSSGGVHVVQMLNILEGYDLKGMGFGSAASLHLVAEALKIAFADRAAATADPAFVKVPVDRLTSKDYAAERRAQLDPARAQAWSAAVAAEESANTTHLTVADSEGRIFCATQTINSLFGARIMIPGLGMIPNNYMALFDPRPGNVLSILPGKRIPTSMSPTILLREGRPWAALGLPGGLRIFGSAMQAVLNLVEYGMTLQQAVEAPRIWTQGQALEVEATVPEAVRDQLRAMGHDVVALPHVAGGMCAVRFHKDGLLEGAACWRADGTAMGFGGGLAREGVRFWPDLRRG